MWATVSADSVQIADAAPKPRGRIRRFAAGMAGADDDDVDRSALRNYFPMQKRSKMCAEHIVAGARAR